MTNARERFREILSRPSCTKAAPIFDPLSARIADMQGWEVCKLSGSVGKFANLAVPDGVPLSNMSDLVDLCRRINRVSESCLIVDADDGGGNAINVVRTVRELESAGVSAIEIEDNRVPAQFGEAKSRHALMVSCDEQVGKLKAAVAARRDRDTVIVARTSALAELPRSEALRRIQAYSESGAEAIMIPRLGGDVAVLDDVCKATHLPLLILGLPLEAASDTAFLASRRIRIRFLENLPFRMAVKAVSDALQNLKDGQTPDDAKGRQIDAEFLREFNRTDEMQAWQKNYIRE